MELVELRDIHKTYHLGEVDVSVLRGVNLRIRRGELLAVMGVSGSGKSTLMNILGCLDHPSSGEYWLEGREISHVPPDERGRIRNERIGFVFQAFNLLSRTSALDNVIMPPASAPKPVSEAEARRRGVELLERLGLGDRLEHTPAQLSGGQQQRVALARALVSRPSILLADEPTGNLDSKTSVEILGEIRELNEKEGITVVLVTHNLEVARYAQRIVYIKDGV